MRHIFILIVSICFSHLSFSQSIKGTISGDGEVLAFANILLLKKDFVVSDGLISNLDGSFEIKDFDPRAKYITASYIGFNNADTIALSSLELDNIEINLSPNPNIIACPIIQTYPYHYFSTIELDAISIKGSHPGLAATFNDPTRSLIRYPGFSAANDQANNYSYRGMPSEFMTWKMDGAEIVNPNHLSNAGTISDRPSTTTGGVMMIPFEALDEFRFHAPSYTKSYNNALAGITDLRPVNDALGKSSFIKFGFLGLEAGFAHHNESGNSLAIHDVYAQYRYSFTGLLADFGVDFDGEEIKYQDAFLRAKILSKDQWSLVTSFAYGNSENDEAQLTNYTSENIISGLSLTKMGSQGRNDFELSLYYSHRNEERSSRNYPFSLDEIDPTPANYRWDVQPSELDMLSLHLDSKIFSSSSTELRAYLNLTNESGMQYWNSTFGSGFEMSGNSYYAGSGNGIFGSAGLGLTKQIGSLSLAFDLSNSLNEKETIIPEARLAIQYSLNNYWSIQATAAKNSQLANRYLASLYDRPINFGFGTPGPIFNDLKSVKSIASNLGIEYKSSGLSRSFSVSVNAFYQYVYDVPISTDQNIFDPYTGIDFLYPTFLVSEGTAINYGLEIRNHAELASNLHLDWNVTIFENTYTRLDDRADYSGPFNYNYVANALLTKRFSWAEEVLFGSLAFHIRDRSLFPTINLEASREEGLSIYNIDFEKQGNIFHRLDLRMRYEFGKNHLILDIQNVLNRKNSTFTFYDVVNDEVAFKEQLGMIPVISYRRLF